MLQSLIKLWVHIIFSTKNREKIIRNDIANELYAYMSSILKSYKSPCLIINGTADHVHILCLQSKDFTLPKLIEEIKKSSSKWIKKKGEKYSKFRWQSGYGALSVSQSQIEELKKYIMNQNEHHKRKTFKEEYREFLEHYEIPYDERYVWD